MNLKNLCKNSSEGTNDQILHKKWKNKPWYFGLFVLSSNNQIFLVPNKTLDQLQEGNYISPLPKLHLTLQFIIVLLLEGS